MRLSLEEMNVLSERLEKEGARLRQLFASTANQGSEQRRLQLISDLQRKFRDCEANLSEEEKSFLSQLLQEEMNYIHGHGTGIYESILAKVES